MTFMHARRAGARIGHTKRAAGTDLPPEEKTEETR